MSKHGFTMGGRVVCTLRKGYTERSAFGVVTGISSETMRVRYCRAKPADGAPEFRQGDFDALVPRQAMFIWNPTQRCMTMYQDNATFWCTVYDEAKDYEAPMFYEN
jgi:hypothetical protein